MRKCFFLAYLFFSIFCFADVEEKKIQVLFNSLNRKSFSELLAFYELYPDTVYGKQSLDLLFSLIKKKPSDSFSLVENIFLPKLDISSLIAIVNKEPYEKPEKLTSTELLLLDNLCSHLGNRKLQGHYVTTTQEIISLPSDQIDIARALLIYQCMNEEDPAIEIKRYEAVLDLMALQIESRLPLLCKDKDKISAINQYIFHEMQFRFPPQSLMAKEVDLYTILPSVLDSRKGVCLGVSILYLSLAQRLNLPLEIITPPGHIYVRYKKNDEEINIETTARGIHIPSENYLGINTYRLSVRTMKEVIGMSFVNQASVLWRNRSYIEAATLYENALNYLPDDPHVKMFLGIQYLLLDQRKKGLDLLSRIRNFVDQDGVYEETLPEDILSYNISKKALEAIFEHVDETRESIVKKQNELKEIVASYPKFRSALLHLAITYFQLGRGKEAYEVLLSYHQVDAKDPTVNYYLSILCLQRFKYLSAWKYLELTHLELRKKNHHPRFLFELEAHLRQVCPEKNHLDGKL